MTPHLVVFTDLDGTLLDPTTYRADAARPALAALQARGIPVVFCSAKTRAELEVHRQALGVTDPFIAENGGAIFIPEGYFPFPLEGAAARDGYQVLELGLPYPEIRRRLKAIEARLGLPVRGFGDLTPQEVAARTGLSLEAARRAQAREYDETLVLEGSPDEVRRILEAIQAAGLRWTHGGRFYHATGPSDKGRAVRILTALFRKAFGPVYTVALGDGPNDRPMLEAVDRPILVEKPTGGWEAMPLAGLQRVRGVGPVGWRRAIEALLDANAPR
ncbi:mannosyl-3-phosphoglycerate phosphatase [Marinithermus hydrothermalis]|uniref:Mannosyl-3-phosphoglycerate phosphatase n=1 Tax=Marinithermus hydrothermalis (strain DSM 14884 / JCM 11576 / T1) TaxID=869210 RepID=F2NKT1_MARHT|nr:mannosyl-3-phosphoglycerate phosphatase [Marinithermus hydrothermalis]AEB10844.1 mannosyl-3-phosphoglycerate phosphatase [Marinithermus hydrothermalis DSM 14884]